MPNKKYDGPRYAYTQGVGKKADDKFDIEAMKNGEARLLDSDIPNQKAMRYIQDDSLSGFINPKVGSGRGGQGGPTAKELADYERKQDAGIYTAEKGKPPTEPEGRKKGGMIESKRTKKFAGGGAMGSAQDMGKSLTELTGSLGSINQGLTGGGTGGGLGGALGGGFTNNLQPQPAMPDYGGYNNLQGGLSQLGMQSKVMKKGGKVKKMASGGVTASKRGDGIAQRGKTRGKMC